MATVEVGHAFLPRGHDARLHIGVADGLVVMVEDGGRPTIPSSDARRILNDAGPERANFAAALPSTAILAS